MPPFTRPRGHRRARARLPPAGAGRPGPKRRAAPAITRLGDAIRSGRGEATEITSRGFAAGWANVVPGGHSRRERGDPVMIADDAHAYGYDTARAGELRQHELQQHELPRR